ncbi:unnamed protein product [Owenia fusiformis]|uniref:Complex I assembly factor TIMMDC1, mitochondrial n=1 Tax=Owenia fusiformis TaxID=6347 RepID=A0A8S4NN35_OWEFU|nr:unnamed protein product [Owenia fusiformis]
MEDISGPDISMRALIQNHQRTQSNQFSHKSQNHLAHQCIGSLQKHRLSYTMYSQFRRMFAIPTVYARDNDDRGDEGMLHDRMPGLMEKMSQKMEPSGSGLQLSRDYSVSEMEIQAFIAGETGMDRLREMYKMDGDQMSEMMQIITAMTAQGAMMTFVCASIIGGWEAKNKFLETNQATRFETKFKAMRAFNDAIFLRGMKEGLRWSFKIGSMTGLFLLVGGCLIYGTLWVGGLLQEQRHAWLITERLKEIKKHQAIQDAAVQASIENAKNRAESL